MDEPGDKISMPVPPLSSSHPRFVSSAAALERYAAVEAKSQCHRDLNDVQRELAKRRFALRKALKAANIPPNEWPPSATDVAMHAREDRRERERDEAFERIKRSGDAQDDATQDAIIDEARRQCQHDLDYAQRDLKETKEELRRRGASGGKRSRKRRTKKSRTIGGKKSRRRLKKRTTIKGGKRKRRSTRRRR